jgi:hypothetical protein
MAGVALTALPVANAVILYATGSTTQNVINSPADHALAKYVGLFGGYTGTPISSHYFITAKHIAVAGNLTLGGSTYTVVSGGEGVGYWSDSQSDLRIVKINESFPVNLIAQIFTASSEVGKTLTVFGRGTQRGSEVNLVGASVADLRGWFWGPSDGKLRWGENVVSGTEAYGSNTDGLLYANFDRNSGLAYEAHLSVGDSGGPIFIEGKLAGINYSVDGYWRHDTINGGAQFNGALFDAGGLQVGSGSTWTSIPDVAGDIPSSFYASRISDRQGWIYTVIPEPGTWTVMVGLGLTGFAAWRRCRPAGVGKP